MSQVTEQSVRFQTALASIKLIQASAVLDLTEDDFDFLTSHKVWIATDRSRARRCVEACVYGTLVFVGYSRFPASFYSSRRRNTRFKCDWSSDCALPILVAKTLVDVDLLRLGVDRDEVAHDLGHDDGVRTDARSAGAIDFDAAHVRRREELAPGVARVDRKSVV